MYIFSKIFEAETLFLGKVLGRFFWFVLSLHLNTPLSKVAIHYLLFVTFQTPIDFIRLRSRFVKETVRPLVYF